MMSRFLFLALAVVVLISGQNYLVVPGTSVIDPIIACAFALVISPWLKRQFD